MDWTGGDQAVVVYSSFDLKLRAFCFGVFNVCSNARMLGNYDNLNNARTRTSSSNMPTSDDTLRLVHSTHVQWWVNWRTTMHANYVE